MALATAPPAPAVVRCGLPTLTCKASAHDDHYTVAYTKTPIRSKIAAVVGLLANDVAPNSSNLTVDLHCSCNTSTYGGTVALAADGSFNYTPPPSFTGVDRFQYSINDGTIGDVSSATVSVTVVPVITSDSYTTAYNTTLAVSAANGVFKNDVPASFDSIVSSTAAGHGNVVLNFATGAFTFVPDHNFTGHDQFTYTVFDLDFDVTYTATVHLTVTPAGTPPPPPPPPPPPGKLPTGYWMVGATGTVYPFGQLRRYGNASTANVTHIEPTPTRKGYWILDSAGHVFSFGDARALGNAGALAPGETASSLSSTPTGKGYWIFTNRGRVFTRGDARSFGDMSGVRLNGPIVGSIPTPTGKGYYMVGSDGGIFAFGNARFFGSMGAAHLNKPVNGIVPTVNSGGYWLVASDGGIFAFGNAGFHGSMGGAHLNRAVIGIVRYGNGYLMVASDGGIFAFSNLPFLGSLGANPPAVPIVGVASGG